MTDPNPFDSSWQKPDAIDEWYSRDEVRLANRNAGLLLETLTEDITPTGLHYLLNHFDVPVLQRAGHTLRFLGAFDDPFDLSIEDIEALPQVTRPVTLECAGNGRAQVRPRSYSMPWAHEAAGTYAWTGTPLAPLIDRASPQADAVEIAFHGADFGYDKGHPHHFGRSLTLDQIAALDVLLVTRQNGQPLLPQHGAPVRLIVPGWYGMASVKWLTGIEALTRPYDGFQQVQTYRFKDHADDPGRPITEMRVKSLMAPPGVPDWVTRQRCVQPGQTQVQGRAWSGAGRRIVRVELGVDDIWSDAELTPPADSYAWTGWQAHWDAQPGQHTLRCRATDEAGNVQPLDPVWDLSGFANNACQTVRVFVPDQGS